MKLELTAFVKRINPCQLVSIIWRKMEKTPAYTSPQTLQIPQNTPNSSSNFSNFRNYPNYFRFPIYKFILQKKFSILYLPNSTTKDIKRHSNFSNFRNYPNYFRFSIYKFILQKNIFYFYISRTTRRPFNAALFLFCQSQLFQFPQLP